MSAYESAVVYVPQRQISLQDGRSSPLKEAEEGEDEDEEPRDPQDASVDIVETLQRDLDSETEKACSTLRAILNANIGACYVKLVSQG